MSEKNATLLGIRLAVGDTSPGCAFAGLDASAWAHITAAVTVSAQSTPCVTHEHNDILVSHGNHFTWGRISAKGFLPLRRIRLAAAIEGDILVRQHVLWMRLAVKLRVGEDQLQLTRMVQVGAPQRRPAGKVPDGFESQHA